jgi:hypothetical protein
MIKTTPESLINLNKCVCCGKYKYIIVAFNGDPRAGKDTCSDYLVSQHNFNVIRIAEPVYRICDHIQQCASVTRKKDRMLLRLVGEGIKTRYEGAWVDICENNIKTHLCAGGTKIVIPDLRYLVEYNKLLEYNVEFIRVVRNIIVPPEDIPTGAEKELVRVPMHKINNAGAVTDMFSLLDNIINKIEICICV